MSVSYTHLDVYKRQTLCITLIKIDTRTHIDTHASGRSGARCCVCMSTRERGGCVYPVPKVVKK